MGGKQFRAHGRLDDLASAFQHRDELAAQRFSPDVASSSIAAATRDRQVTATAPVRSMAAAAVSRPGSSTRRVLCALTVSAMAAASGLRVTVPPVQR